MERIFPYLNGTYFLARHADSDKFLPDGFLKRFSLLKIDSEYFFNSTNIFFHPHVFSKDQMTSCIINGF